MAFATSDYEKISELISINEVVVTKYYKVVTLVLLTTLFLHIVFSGGYIVLSPSENTSQVLQFVAFNVTVLIIEVILSRMAFMLGARSGQLRDLHLSVVLSSSIKEPQNLEIISGTIMSLRREHTGLKIFDIEALSSRLNNKKE